MISLRYVHNQIAALRLRDKDLDDALVRDQNRIDILFQANKVRRVI
jgi:hypothetical protein